LLATGKALMAFKHLPLDAIHPLATQAAKFADCAGKHGQFWSAHDALFRAPFDASPEGLRRIWKESGLPDDALAPCLATSNLEQVATNADEATKLYVTGTPTFFVGYVEPNQQLRVTDRLIGAVKPSQIAEVVDRLLASK
jgi:protein-disulfide isomerase